MRLHTISVLVQNHPGVLSRITGLFSRRGFNIESLAVGTCAEPGMSRMTITAGADDAGVEQVRKQLEKLIDVIRVSDITSAERVERELALIRVPAATGTVRAEILQVASVFRAAVVDVSPGSVVLEVTGDTDKVDALERLLRKYGVKEFVRTGRVAVTRGRAG